MFIKADNDKIGEYLTQRILSRYPSVRQFCPDYLRISLHSNNPSEYTDPVKINQAANHLSNIKLGVIAISLDDLPVFCELLDLTCEELLSAGACHVPDASRMTIQQFASSTDSAVWDIFINREDHLFLNTDEFGKNIIDYALEYKNYTLLKYLLDNKYIWFDSGNQQDYIRSFGAGTSIKRKPYYLIDDLDAQLKERDDLRREMIILAIEHDDLDMLSELRAREIPALYLSRYGAGNPNIPTLSHDDKFISAISSASKKVIEYFSLEFDLSGGTTKTAFFTFPYLNEVLDQLVQNNHPCCETILRKCIAHNQKILNRLHQMLDLAIEDADALYGNSSMRRHPCTKEEIIDIGKHSMRCFCKNNLISVFVYMLPEHYDSMASNIISISASAHHPSIQSLINHINSQTNNITTFLPDVKEG